VARVGDLDPKSATSDGENLLGLLDDPFRDGNAAVRLGKRLRPPGPIKLVWVAALHAVPPKCGDGHGVDDDALAPRVRRRLELLTLGSEVGVRVVAPGQEVEPMRGARFDLLVVKSPGASVLLVPLMGLVTMLRARARLPLANPENDPSDISRRLRGIVLIRGGAIVGGSICFGRSSGLREIDGAANNVRGCLSHISNERGIAR
jgi:hypothetical protein